MLFQVFSYFEDIFHNKQYMCKNKKEKTGFVPADSRSLELIGETVSLINWDVSIVNKYLWDMSILNK